MEIPSLSLVIVHSAIANATAARDFATSRFADILEADDFETLETLVDERLEEGGQAIVQGDYKDDELMRLRKCAIDNDVDCIVLAWQGHRLEHSLGLGLRDVRSIDADTSIDFISLGCDRREELGPFDLIGDVHGCIEELHALLARLGWQRDGDSYIYPHAPSRRLVFLGDLVDRGPDSPAVLELVMDLVAQGRAFCVPGNHDAKLLRHLSGEHVRISHGLKETLEQFAESPASLASRVKTFLRSLVPHLVLDQGRLVVAHAGIQERYQGRNSGRIRSFCYYGDTNGETDSFGLPIRYNWALDYKGDATVVYGHTPVQSASWINSTICIDTGCVFGGKLTALRYPERELVSVPALATYYETPRPFITAPDWGSANPRMRKS